MKKLFTLCFLIITVTLSGQNSRFITIDADAINSFRERARKNDPEVKPYYDMVIAGGEKALKQRPVSVTEKTVTPPSGDKHDYMSMGPYWWPDPTKPNGLPYIRRDGEINPERKNIPDEQYMGSIMNALYNLGLAYYISGDEKYAAHAAKLANVWYIDPATKMNPNLIFGQALPGINDGRCIGIIETAGLVNTVTGAFLLEGSPSWKGYTENGFKTWIKEYLHWLENHKFGIEERSTLNNHATHYDAQVCAMMLYLDQQESARKHIETYTKPRLLQQVSPDGAQKEELARTKSWGYSNMNLRGFLSLALMADKVGLDLWNYTADGRTPLKNAIDWFEPYVNGKTWDYTQIEPISAATIDYTLAVATRKYKDPKYAQLLEKRSDIARQKPDQRDEKMVKQNTTKAKNNVYEMLLPLK